MTTENQLLREALLPKKDRAFLGQPFELLGLDELSSLSEYYRRVQALIQRIEALTQPAQAGEAVAWLCNWPGQGKETWHHVYINESDAIDRKRNSGGEIVPLYTTPPASQEPCRHPKRSVAECKGIAELEDQAGGVIAAGALVGQPASQEQHITHPGDCRCQWCRGKTPRQGIRAQLTAAHQATKAKEGGA